ncbi:MAG: F0F1 ATP synthase subunit A [Anaerolineae bacterium]|nr:F0F1 ATP synthase subunit A [Anaerolineae bacterium]
MHITLAPEPIFQVGPLVVTNTMVTSALVVLILSVVAVIYRSVITAEKPGRFQSVVEWVLGYVLGLCEQTAGKALGRRIFPLVATFFIFILSANWIGLLPGFHFITVTNSEGFAVPLLRSANSDWNMTAALALVAVVTVQVMGVREHGVKGYLKELATPPLLAPIHVVSELSHVISLSGRLFGNIFGGEVLMLVMYTLVPYVVPAVFIGLEMFFGFIQALIFTVLTIVYIALAAAPAHEEAA